MQIHLKNHMLEVVAHHKRHLHGHILRHSQMTNTGHSTRSKIKRNCLSCDYISLHKPLQHIYKTRKEDMLGEGSLSCCGEQFHWREDSPQLDNNVLSHNAVHLGPDKETASGLWLCSQKRPGRGLSSTTELAGGKHWIQICCRITPQGTEGWCSLRWSNTKSLWLREVNSNLFYLECPLYW